MKKTLYMLALCLLALVFVACDKGPKEETLVFEDGRVYTGIVVDGKANGEGTLSDEMGSVWTGTFVDNQLTGYGTYVGYDYTEYEGFFENGVFHGFGIMTASNGDYYVGMFENDKKNGFGRMEFATGCVYEGGWKDGHMHGMGWMTWPVGDAYFGQWAHGNPNGFGCKVFYDPAFSVKGDYFTYNMYVGGIKDNLMHGWGIMRFSETGGIYLGNWDAGIRDDTQGIYYFEEGLELVKFIGSFSKSMNNGWIWGEGTMYYRNGLQIHGIFEGTTCVQEFSRTYYDFDADEYVTIENELMNNAYVQGLLNNIK